MSVWSVWRCGCVEGVGVWVCGGVGEVLFPLSSFPSRSSVPAS